MTRKEKIGWTIGLSLIVIAIAIIFGLFLKAVLLVRQDDIHSYYEAVELYDSGEYALALQKFYHLTGYQDRIFDGDPPHVYIDRCYAILEEMVEICPNCGYHIVDGGTVHESDG